MKGSAATMRRTMATKSKKGTKAKQDTLQEPVLDPTPAGTDTPKTEETVKAPETVVAPAAVPEWQKALEEDYGHIIRNRDQTALLTAILTELVKIRVR